MGSVAAARARPARRHARHRRLRQDRPGRRPPRARASRCACSTPRTATSSMHHATPAIPRALDDLLQSSDFVTLHVPLTPHTRHMIGERELRLMRQTAILVNTSRGAVVDQPALVARAHRRLDRRRRPRCDGRRAAAPVRRAALSAERRPAAAYRQRQPRHPRPHDGVASPVAGESAPAPYAPRAARAARSQADSDAAPAISGSPPSYRSCTSLRPRSRSCAEITHLDPSPPVAVQSQKMSQKTRNAVPYAEDV